MGRLCNFNIRVEPTTIPNIHLYEATPKSALLLKPNNINNTRPRSSSVSSTSVTSSSNSTSAGNPLVVVPRYFIRILLHIRMSNDEQLTAKQERHLVAALNALEMILKSSAATSQSGRPTPSHHILMSVTLHPTNSHTANSSGNSSSNGVFRVSGTPCQRLSPSDAEASMTELARRYQQRLMHNRVDVVEVRYTQRSVQGEEEQHFY